MFLLRLTFGISLATILVAPNYALTAQRQDKRRPPSDASQFVAQSNASDPGARQIVRTVANETLKTISTKEATSIDDNGGPILVPTKVEVEDAPGARLPKLKAESSTESSQVNSTAHSDISADQALSWLKNGNTRFVKSAFRKDGSNLSDRKRLMKSEKPYAIVLACSDSRVPPEAVFDQALGEIYVIRTAGQSVDGAVIASIEHAVQTLGPKLVVVMGHTSCSAVQAALDTGDEDSSGSPTLDALVSNIRPRLPMSAQSRSIATTASVGLEIESSANAQGAARDLLSKSEILRRRVEAGELVIVPALYHLESGSVKFY